MSKRIRLGMVIVLAGVLGLVIDRVVKPKQFESVPTEVSIQEASLATGETETYEDWAGFRFEYPKELKIEEIELEDEMVYSSLEISGPGGQKLRLRISDTQYKDLTDWQDEFEQENVLMESKDIYWADISGRQISFGAPGQLMSVAIDQQIIYELQNPTDDGGFWDKTHQMILNSFEFSEAVISQPEEKVVQTDEDENIILLEEKVIE